MDRPAATAGGRTARTQRWDAFIRARSKNLVENVDGAIYCCMSPKEWGSVSQALAEAGGHWSDTIIWTKDRFTLGRADYQRQYGGARSR